MTAAGLAGTAARLARARPLLASLQKGEFERFRSWLLSGLVSSCPTATGLPNTDTSSLFNTFKETITFKLAGAMVHLKKGELTQEEKALLEVIGKGTVLGCYGALPALPGGMAEPAGTPSPADPCLRFCEVEQGN